MGRQPEVPYRYREGWPIQGTHDEEKSGMGLAPDGPRAEQVENDLKPKATSSGET